ncbi:Phosphatidylethanolamine-binding protein [Teratosphaeria destructans]|uniref:Phosphatidylethanolamine-binding protein n=1 Tax=Teratosphaeria destructans TaxID=418781 RepID=A0A9W7W1C3_9PEZI|nr:Phosphatidylethanolamine-binding protein [Teratosphaeria destructans]
MKPSSVLSVLAPFVALAHAQTPNGSEPATNNALTVTYNSTTITPGQLFLPSSLGNTPQVSSDQELNGTYLLLFVDLSLGAASAAASLNGTGGLAAGFRCNGTTRLHWAQGNVTQAANGTLLTSNSGAISLYNTPNPPATNPTPNVYTFYLFSQPPNFTLPAWDADRDLYATSSSARLNFSVQAIADEVGPPVAATYLQAAKNGSNSTQVPLHQLNRTCGSALNTTIGTGSGSGAASTNGASNGKGLEAAVWVMLASVAGAMAVFV